MRRLPASRLLSLAAAIAALSAGPALAAIDLQVTSLAFQQPPKIGNCNTLNIAVTNNGDQLGNAITGAQVRVFPSDNAFSPVVRNVFFSSFQPGGTQTRTLSNVDLPEGEQYTVQVVADCCNSSGQALTNGQLAESNENNNTQTIFVTPSQPCGGGNCDLTATFTSPAQGILPGTYPANLSVQFGNAGGAACAAQSVTLLRSGTPVGTQALSSLNPGQTKSLGWSDTNHPAAGQVVYGLQYGAAPDSNSSNHQPTKSLTFSAPSVPVIPTPIQPSACDLQATFVAPGASTLSGGGTVGWQLSFKNGGSAQCPAAKLKLMRYTGSTCSGYGSQVGGSGAWQAINALAPNQSAVVTFLEQSTPAKGAYCYKLGYSGAYNDANGGNHHPEKKVTFN
jgi:hypothetical protein